MGRLFELLFTIVFGALAVYLIARLVRPRTTREVAGRPRSIFDRLHGPVDAYASATDAELRDELETELHDIFRDALIDHRVAPAEYRLVLRADELGCMDARVQRAADGASWTLQEFDDYLLARGAA